jgi:hypothetical protein
MTHVHTLETQVYKFLLDVVQFGYSKEYIKAIAMVHSRPAKLLTQALDWGIIDNETYQTWVSEIL